LFYRVGESTSNPTTDWLIRSPYLRPTGSGWYT
jgi:hypothetical protein